MKMKWKGASVSLLIVGGLLAVAGLVGLFGFEQLGPFTTNRLRAVLELALGAGGGVAVGRGRPLGYLTTLGGVLAALALLWAVPLTTDFCRTQLALNAPVAIAYFAWAVFSVLAGSASGVRVDSPDLERDRTRARKAGTVH